MQSDKLNFPARWTYRTRYSTEYGRVSQSLPPRVGDIPSPVRSPELMVPNASYGDIRKKAYTECAHTQQGSGSVIFRIRLQPNQEVLLRVLDSFVNHLEQCVTNEGGHNQDVVYKM